MLVSTLIFFGALALCYLFYISISGTPSEDALWSIIAIAIVYEVLSYLPIDWLIFSTVGQWLKPAIFILLTMIFAQDIKRLLSKWGRRIKIKSFLRTHELSQATIDEIVHGVHLLSKSSIGGLIVIQQRADLSSIVRGGIELDARVESGLLYAIFISHRYNHLHDGAALIYEDRITHAAVYLPMTRSMNLDKHLGTRHRAALGISEETDAIVIVVSEERGTVSLAYGGKLMEDVEIRKLKQRLESFVHNSSLDRINI
jgi:diadenylate cyclase